ncbi:hypothetical protein GCM10023212_00390 [Luteolibacter yonseiensis]
MAQSTWTGATTNWSTATNWTPGLPASGANVTIADATTNGTLTLDDGSHTIGSFTFGATGTRTNALVVQTNTANTLTIGGGLTANGSFTAIGLRLRGNYVIPSDQAWQVNGLVGSHSVDSGVAVNEVSAGNLGTFALNANLSKSGPGQLTFGATTISGAGDININEGSVKLNGGGSMLLTVGGAGKIAVNNSSSLIFSKNSGTFNIARFLQFNNTSNLVTGSGSNGTTGTFDVPANMEWNGIHTISNNTNANNVGTVNYRFTGVMSGSGSITKNGASQLILAGTTANTLGGQVTVAAGELSLDKTGVVAVPGNVVLTGGVLRINQSNQIANTSSIVVTGGGITFTADRTQTLSSLSIGSAAVSSLSGFNVTGVTALTSGRHQINSGQTFTTQSLSVSNNSILQFVGNSATTSSTANVGAGGLVLTNGIVQFGDAVSPTGYTAANQFNLSGDVVSTGNSAFTILNGNGPRLLDLQGGSRAFAVNDGTLEIKASVQNGTFVKSGAGSLLLSYGGSTANFSFTEGPVRIAGQTNAGNISLSAGSLQMDVSGDTPAKIVTTGDFTLTGGSIEIASAVGNVTPGVIELVRYGGNLVGTPTINIPPQLQGSRVNPVISYGTGSNSAITLTSTAVPLGLVWSGATGGIWDNNNTSNFNAGAQKFYPLDSVTFNDTGANASVVLNSVVVPTDVQFNHGETRPTYTVSGTGGIGGITNLTKSGTGTTILATDNTYTGTTNILEGILQVGSGGLVGSLGTGPVAVNSELFLSPTLAFSRAGTAVVGNIITGNGNIRNNGPGTVAFTANSTGFTGSVAVAAGTLQFGDGGADGSLGGAFIDVSGGATFAIKRTGTPTIVNSISGLGGVSVIGGSPILAGSNSSEGGLTIRDGGVVRTTSDFTLGGYANEVVPNAIRLISGGLKNQDSDTSTDINRGITITDEAYFTAGWIKSLTIGGPITGTGNVFINYDSGRVVFANTTSDWNGSLTIGAEKPGFTTGYAGTFQINTINNAGEAGTLGKASADAANLAFNNGRLVYTGENASSNRGFTLQGAGTIEVVNATTALALSGNATGPGAFTKLGAGTLVLSGNSDFAGIKTISAGTVVLKSTNGLGGTEGFVKFTTGASAPGILELATNTSVAAYGLDMAAGTQGTIQSGVGTPGPGINHTLGNFTLSSATLNVVASPSVTGGDPRVTIGSLSLSAGAVGTTTFNPTTANITLGPVSIGIGNFAKTLSLGGTSVGNQASGVISDGLNVVSLTKANDSTWTVSGNNTFTGNVTVDDGVLSLTHSNALGAAGKTLIIAGDAGGNRIPELQLSGNISPVVANLQISGAGVGNLTGALRNVSGNNTITVTTQVTMRTGNGNTTLFSDAGTLTLNSPLVTANATGRALTLAGPGNGIINAVIANGSTGALPVTKTGAGTWTLNGAQTYSGATTVNEGTLSLGQAALSDTAAVVIASGAKLNLNFTGIDRVGSLTINGELKPEGVYDANNTAGFITGTGSIRVGAGPQGYTTWASNYPFTVGVNDGPNQDPDGDGISNLLEYVLGGVPVGTGAANTSILPTQALNATALVLTFRRSDISESDVTLKVQWSDNLVTWNDFATIGAVDSLPAVDITENSPNADLDTVVVTIPRSTTSGGKLFARVKASK